MNRPAFMCRFAAARAAAIASVIASSACAGDIVPPEPAPHVTITGGDGQSGTALQALALPLEVTLVNDAGEPVAGRTVTWATADPTARLLPMAGTTDAAGRARALWVLGIASGVHTATVIVTGEDGAIEFTATGSPVAGLKAISLMQGSTNAAGDPHMCAIGADSTAWCWGGNQFGQLGNGTTSGSGVPLPVGGGRSYARIYGDDFNTCGLRASGELWCWGRNTVSSGGPFSGVFGNGSPTEPSSRPVRAAQGLLLQDFDLEAGLACGIAMDGRAYCWGDGDGALGTGTGVDAPAVPTEILGDRLWREIAVSDDGRCAIAEDHRAYCWFDPDFPRFPWIGIPREAGPNDTPLRVEIVGALADLTIGEFGACGMSLEGAGTAACWGFRSSVPPPGPAYHRLGSTTRSIVSDGFGRAALDSEGQLWLWSGGCCDTSGGLGPPRLVFPGVAWREVSLAHGIHVISERDSIVFSLGPIPQSVGTATFELVPVPLP